MSHLKEGRGLLVMARAMSGGHSAFFLSVFLSQPSTFESLTFWNFPGSKGISCTALLFGGRALMTWARPFLLGTCSCVDQGLG